jgi:dinuclear metal center YbgI/SA1388 family protein
MGGEEEKAMTLQTTAKSLVEVKDYLDALLKVAGLDESGNGLVVGGRPTVSKVGLAVNCSLQAIEGAAQRGCDLLITHHAAWPKIDQHLSEQKYGRLRQLGLNYYAAHECLDLAREFGTSDALARAVRVAVQGTFDLEGEAVAVHGLTTGHFLEFVVRVGNQLGVEPRKWKNNDGFGHVGIIPGWGGRTDWMAQAQALGCDTFLTGEASMFGILFAKEAGLNLVVAGHYATETPGVMALSARLARDLKVEVTFIPEEVVEA